MGEEEPEEFFSPERPYFDVTERDKHTIRILKKIYDFQRDLVAWMVITELHVEENGVTYCEKGYTIAFHAETGELVLIDEIN